MQEKDPSINDLLLLQPKSVTFGQYEISEWQENILTLITESLQKHMTREKPLNTDLFGEPYVIIKCDEAGGTNNKTKVIASAKDLISKVFSFQWKSKNGKTVKSTGTIITTIHDVEGSNNLTINFNKWAHLLKFMVKLLLPSTSCIVVMMVPVDLTVFPFLLFH